MNQRLNNEVSIESNETAAISAMVHSYLTTNEVELRLHGTFGLRKYDSYVLQVECKLHSLD